MCLKIQTGDGTLEDFCHILHIIIYLLFLFKHIMQTSGLTSVVWVGDHLRPTTPTTTNLHTNPPTPKIFLLLFYYLTFEVPGLVLPLYLGPRSSLFGPWDSDPMGTLTLTWEHLTFPWTHAQCFHSLTGDILSLITCHKMDHPNSNHLDSGSKHYLNLWIKDVNSWLSTWRVNLITNPNLSYYIGLIGADLKVNVWAVSFCNQSSAQRSTDLSGLAR